MPKNLARWHFGATLIMTDVSGLEPREEFAMPAGPREPEGILLGDDETESFALEPGTYTYIVNFRNMEIIDRFFAKTFSGTGMVTVRASEFKSSLESDDWLNISRPIGFIGSSYIEREFVPIEAQYVAFTYEIEETAEIGSLGIVGDLSIAEALLPSRLENQLYAQSNRDPDDFYNFDFASIYSGSRISFVNKEEDPEGAERMIDDDFKTYYDFKAESERDALIIDLNDTTYINKISLLVAANKGTMRFYFIDEIPGDEEDEEGPAEAAAAIEEAPIETSAIFQYNQLTDSTGTPILWAQEGDPSTPIGSTLTRAIAIDPDSLADSTPTLTVEIENNAERVSFPVDDLNTRYVLMLWEPEDPSGSDPLRIFEISVFGPMPAIERLVARAIPTEQLPDAPGGNVEDPPDAPTEAGEISPAGDPEEPIVPPVTDISEL